MRKALQRYDEGTSGVAPTDFRLEGKSEMYPMDIETIYRCLVPPLSGTRCHMLQESTDMIRIHLKALVNMSC